MATEAFKKVEAVIREMQNAQVQTPEELEHFRIQFLGTKNIIKPLMAEIRNIPNEQKRAFGQLINQAKEIATEKFKSLQMAIESAADQANANHLDLTAPAEPIPLGARHPIAIVMNRFIEIFARIGFTVAEEREIEEDWYNFTAMNTPEDHPARDMQDTFYVRDVEGMLLRTHTSSVQARVMTTQKPPIRIIAPGRVYRNETISARSHCQFHQVEGLYVDEGVSFADMKQTLLYFAKEMYGEQTKIRLRPSYFPFTEPSAEMDVWMGTDTPEAYRLTKGTGWLEVLGCGIVDPNVLDNCGIDSKKYSGFAFGIGIERTAMQKYNINDIRYLFENDVRLMGQFSKVI
ncbi:MAG: phenylalanine--tRNA ligase subunit alpha [Bacteroidota bacterium]